jgi:peptidoglycan hydrolase-like amidase
VLLYELTTQYKTFEIKCEEYCLVEIDHQLTYLRPFQATITLANDEISIQSEQFPATKAQQILIGANMVEITNYTRKSYAGIPRNTFRGLLIFQKDTYKTTDGTQKTGFVVINQLPFSDYLKGIVETNDQEHLEKNKVMALIAKNYALFYLGKKNLHPNIPEQASYVAIDSPEMFQKYVGAGAEKTLTKRYEALEATKNQVVMYS